MLYNINFSVIEEILKTYNTKSCKYTGDAELVRLNCKYITVSAQGHILSYGSSAHGWEKYSRKLKYAMCQADFQ